MRPLDTLVLGVLKDLKDQGSFEKAPFEIADICKSIRKMRGGIEIQFWEVDYEVGAIGGRLELAERRECPSAALAEPGRVTESTNLLPVRTFFPMFPATYSAG